MTSCRMTPRRRPAAPVVFALLPAFLLQVGPPASASPPPRKKLIETGWDMPTPRQVRDHLTEMESRPFDGVVISLSPLLASAFERRDWKPEDLREPVADLKACRFKRFTDNFIMLNANPGNVDWFDDAGWASIAGHWRLAAWAARESGVRGILFDPEAYVSPFAQFRYSVQPQRAAHDFAAYAAQARRRGREVIRAVTAEYPDITLFSYFLLSYAAPVTGSSRPRHVPADQGYGLLMPFLDGWLDAAPPTMTFIDGDERGYRYNDPADYLAAAVQIKGEFAWHVSPENRGKYRSQVRVSSGLYLDAYVNPPTSGWYIDPRGRPRVQRLAENAASALQAADDYVWIYGEKGRWWPNDKSSHKPWPEILPGCDLALASARDPVGTALAQVEAQRKAGQVRDLARNGAFRSGPADASGKGPPSEWTSWQAEGSHGQFDWERGDGQGAARLTAVRDGCLLQSFPATPGQRYLVTARVRSTGPAEPCIRIRWQTGDGGWTTPSRDVVFHAPAESPRDWGTISGVATVPEAAGRLVILLGVSGAGAVDESAWFDDVHAFLLP